VPEPCQVAQYAESVVSGETVAGRLVRLACQRHLDDLERGHERGLRWDGEAAERAIGFFPFLQHSKGEWAGKPIHLSPWQAFTAGSVFGWKRADGTRRFRISYKEVARKNGKSTEAAGIGLYLLIAEGEPGAEIYTSATKLDQARIVHGEAIRMVKSSRALSGRVAVFKNNLSVEATNSKYEPLGADSKTLDGLNPSGVIADEVHAWPGRQLWDVLETATGARRQPLLFAITTAGFDRHSLCWELHDYAARVLEGAVPDDSFFAYVATLDPEDDWRDEACWAKGNPNLGFSVRLEEMREKFRKALELPSEQNAFRRLRLNEWTDQQTAWLSRELWERGARPVDVNALLGRPCYGALDLASTSDVTAWVLVFPMDDGTYHLLPRFWIPGDSAADRERKDRVPYRHWAAKGLITLTPGNVTDYARVEADVKADAERFRIEDVAYDDWNATHMALNLQAHGLKMVKFTQNLRNFNEPTKQFEALLKEGKIVHGSHPVLDWMAGNVSIITDNSGNIRPVKPDHKESRKVDGIVAAVMALGRALLQPGEDDWYKPGVLLS
jgi:phage terminase large subunit-like protein